MTELYIFDENFEILALIDGFTALEWTRRCYDCGEAALSLPDSTHYAELLRGRYLFRADTGESALIESVTLHRSGDTVRVTVGGRTPEALLAQRVIPAFTEVNGAAGEVIRTLVAANAAEGTAAAGRGIPRLDLAADGEDGGQVSLQLMGENLLEVIHSLCREQQLFIRLQPDPVSRRLVFSVCCGLDRTTAQTVNPWAVFSDDFENIASSRCRRDTSHFRNFAYIYGETADDTPLLLELDHIPSGGERRELFVRATGISQRSDGVVMPLADFQALLLQRGEEELSRYPLVDAVEGTAVGGGSLVCRRDFDLGDLCEYADAAHGIFTAARIIEVTERISPDGVSTLVRLSS